MYAGFTKQRRQTTVDVSWNSTELQSVLLGILSGSAKRRSAVRCMLSRARFSDAALLSTARPVRTLFVVGRHFTDPNATTEDDLLRVDVDDSGARAGIKFGTLGSVIPLLKQAHFLLYAATQPEQVVAVAEDDCFISLPALHFFANALGCTLGPLWHAGSFEWYNWAPAMMKATGYGGAGRARFAGHQGKVFANCSIERFDLSHDSPKRCVGPLMFAKGALFMMTREVVRRVAALPQLSVDMARAEAVGNGTERLPGKWMIMQDVHLGFLLTMVDSVEYVNFGQGFHDRRGGAWWSDVPASALLAAHRLPYTCWGEAVGAAHEWQSERATVALSPVGGIDRNGTLESAHPATQLVRDARLSADVPGTLHCNVSSDLQFKLGDTSCTGGVT